VQSSILKIFEAELRNKCFYVKQTIRIFSSLKLIFMYILELNESSLLDKNIANMCENVYLYKYLRLPIFTHIYYR
jgi:hypothetical protein